MASSTRVLAAHGALLLLLLSVGIGLFFLWWPTCLAPPRAEVTVTEISIPEPGKADIVYDLRLNYGWGILWQYDFNRGERIDWRTASDYWIDDDKRRFRWPSTTRDNVFRFKATLDDGAPADEATIRRRILIQPGVYSLHPGEKLMVYRDKRPDGKLLQGYVEMLPDPQKEDVMEYKPEPGK